MIPPDLGKEYVRRHERQLREQEQQRLADRPWELENNRITRRKDFVWAKLMALALSIVAIVLLVSWIASLTQS